MDRSEQEGREHRVGLPPVLGTEPKVLILGTIPSVQSALRGQYYGNPLNHFWRLMSEVLSEGFPEDYPGRCDMLKRGRIAVWDVLAECDIRGSKDHTIIKPVPNDLSTFLKENEGVRHVFVNGRTAYKFYLKYHQDAFNGTVKVLPSSSPANAMRWGERSEAWMAVRDALRT